ncbi:Nuclear pore-associated protein 1 [Saguinus oedipus]|uniref:Nuclear pore-associated protein 1 n=1 Tax=Saguinus oedipus TaxID=9490 RepID=A0ABQ9VEM0_SAGOE|nr:Nuclear pore-associated protein 1 [Saguinus oedipus]
MGNLLSKFRPRCRRRPLPGPGREAPAPLARDACPPGRAHSAPTPRPFRCLFRRNARRRPSPASVFVAPERQCPLPRAAAAPLGVLPAVGWGPAPRKTLVLPARNPPRFRHPSSVRIPPPSRAFALRLPSPPERAVGARKPIPATLPEGTEVWAQEGPRTVMEAEASVQIEGQDDKTRAPLRSGEASSTFRSQGTQGDLSPCRCSPEPLGGNVHHKGSEKNLTEKAQASPAGSCLEGPALPRACSQARYALHLGKPDPDAAVPPDPARGGSLLPQMSTAEVLNEERLPSSPGLPRPLMSGDWMPDGKPSGIPPRSAAPPRAAHSRPCKRKMSIPLLLPLPPSLPLLWDRGELPPPAKLPCLSVEGDLGTLEKSPGYKRNSRILKDETEAMKNSSVTQPAPSFSPPVETIDSQPLATATSISQVPAPSPIPDLADLATRPPILPVPPLSTTPIMDQNITLAIPNTPLALSADLVPILGCQSNEKGGSCHSIVGSAPPASNPPTPPSPTPFSLKPPFRWESLIPIPVDSPPPLFFPTPLPVPSTMTSVITSKPVNSTSVVSTITANTSAQLTSQTAVDHEAVNMDTTTPSQAVVFTSSPSSRVSSLPVSQIHCSTEQRHPGKTSVYIPPLTFIFHNTTPSFNQLFSIEAISQSNSGALDGQQQKASLPSACVFPSLPIVAPPDTSTLVNSASAPSLSKPAIDTNAMNTTPPSKSATLQSASVSGKKCLPFYMGLPGSENILPNGNVASAQGSTSLPAQSFRGPTTTSNYPLNPGATTQPKFGAPEGQQQKASLPSAHDFPSLPIMVPPDASTLVSNASAASLSKPAIDTNAMNTTPPSKTVILQSTFVSRKEYIQFFVGPSGSENTLPSDSSASAQVSTSLPAHADGRPAISSSHPLNMGAISHSTLGATDEQQKSDSSFILGNPATPAPVSDLPSPSAELTSPYSAFGTPINGQPAKGHNASAFSSGIAKTSEFRVATGMPITGDSTSLVGNTILGPQVIMGPGTPMDGGSIGFSMSLPGPSSTSEELNTGQQQSGIPSTTSIPPFGQVTWDSAGHSMAAAPQGTSNIPVYPSAATYIPGFEPPTQHSGSSMGGDDTKPMVGGPCVPAFQQCILQHTWTEKKFYTSSTYHYRQETYVKRHVCFQLP